MLLDIAVFSALAWLLATILRLICFRKNPAPAGLVWSSAIIVGGGAFYLFYWGQLESYRLLMTGLFGEGAAQVRRFTPTPPIFSSILVATVWLNTLNGKLALPRRKPRAAPLPTPDATEIASKPDHSGQDIATSNPARTPKRAVLIGTFVLGAAIATVIFALMSPSSFTTFGQQSSEQCLASRMRDAHTSPELAAAQAYCYQLPSDTELHCRNRIDGAQASVEGTVDQRYNNSWWLEVYSSDAQREYGAFTISIRFSDNSRRQYDVTLYDRARARTVVSGSFRPVFEDRHKRAVAFTIVTAMACDR